MVIDLSEFHSMSICVAVSGGRDSMALLHFFLMHAKEHFITLTAVNCDHKIRGEASKSDSEFVKNYCFEHGIPLAFYEYTGEYGERLSEMHARCFRHDCFYKTVCGGVKAGDKTIKVDAIATAHHLEDNAETVIFNIARGAGLSGACGIKNEDIGKSDKPYGDEDKDLGGKFRIIHPMTGCTREEIDAYIDKNNIPYVTDESNLSDDYTRNRIRHNVLPELEQVVPGAQKALYRFSRIVQENEAYFARLIAKMHMVRDVRGGYLISKCLDATVFSHAVVSVFERFGIRDYTFEHVKRLYELQSMDCGRKFLFLGISARSEEGGITLCMDNEQEDRGQLSFKEALKNDTFFCEICKIAPYDDILKETEKLAYSGEKRSPRKILKFDRDKISEGCVIRFRQSGDTFTKFGGGTKNLGDYLTDKKIPERVRDRIPLLAIGSKVLIVGGVEISESVKVTPDTKNIYGMLCADYKYI